MLRILITLLLAAGFAVSAKADNFCAYSSGAPIDSTDIFLLTEDGCAAGATKKVTGSNFASYVFTQNAANLTLATNGALRTATSSGNTAKLQAYDVDGSAYVTGLTMTAGNTPTFDLVNTMTIGGSYIYRAGGNEVAYADGGTGIAWDDPNEDQILFWDDSAGSFAGLEIGTGLSISGTEITASTSLSDGDKGDIVVSGSGATWAIDSGAIVNADINASAAIDATKIHDGSISNTEFGYLNGVSSALQTQIDGKQATGNYITALTGDVTASGPGSAAAIIGNDKILESMLKAVDSATDEECLTYETTTGDFEWQTCGSGGGGAPTDADYLVGTANGSLSAEIVVGTSPGGELGGTWASPTVDDNLTVTGWALGTIASGVGTALTALDGENIQDDTIDDDSIDFADVTLADITFDVGSVDTTEFGYLNGVTSSIQTQISGKQGTLTNSAGLASAISDETGTGVAVFNNSPTLISPALGTIASGVGTALTALDGENIQDDTIDDDSIDFSDVTGADLTLTDAGAITASGLVTATANLNISNGTASSGVLRIFEDGDNLGNNHVAFKVPSIVGDIEYTLPIDDGANGDILATNGSGVLSWTSAIASPENVIPYVGFDSNITASVLPGFYYTNSLIADVTFTFPDNPDDGTYLYIFNDSASHDVLLDTETSSNGIFDVFLQTQVETIETGVGYFATYSDTNSSWYGFPITNDASAISWDTIADAAALGSVSFAGFDQDIVSSEDGGDILTITNTDADQAADSIVLRLATNDTSDANTIFIRGTTDDDGTPATDWNVAPTGTAGGLTETLGATGVRLTTDGDGAITFLGLSAGADEDFTINLDDTANEVDVSTGSGVLDWDFNGMDVNTDTLDLTGTGTINGLDAIDATSETTLEAALDIGGEVTSTGMSSTVIADSVSVATWTMTGAPGVTFSNEATSSGCADFREDSDNGSNRVRLCGPASTADVQLDLQATAGTIYSSGGTNIAIADGGCNADTASACFDNIKQAASTTATGVTELSTDTEAKAMTDTARSLTPSNLAAVFIGAQGMQSSVTSISSGSWTTVAFNTEGWDDAAFHDNVTNNSRLTIPSGGDGRYLITAGAEMAMTDNGDYGIAIPLNGTRGTCVEYHDDGALTENSKLSISCIFNLAATNYVELQLFQQSGAAKNTVAANTTLTIQRLR
jgi:hypothetical protein